MELAYQCCSSPVDARCVDIVRRQQKASSPRSKPEEGIAGFLRWATGSDTFDFEHPLIK